MDDDAAAPTSGHLQREEGTVAPHERAVRRERVTRFTGIPRRGEPVSGQERETNVSTHVVHGDHPVRQRCPTPGARAQVPAR